MKLGAENVYADDTQRQILATFSDWLDRIYVNDSMNNLHSLIAQEDEK